MLQRTEVMENWTRPILIREKFGLGINVPDNTPDLLRNIVDTIGFRVCSSSSTCVYIYIAGREMIFDIIDSYQQCTFRMSLGRFLRNFETAEEGQVYNLISLELSDTL